MKLIRKKSKYFNFYHYFRNNEHVFSTEMINGKEKRIDKQTALKFDELAEYQIFREKQVKNIFNQLKFNCKTIIFNNSIENFKYQVNIEIKKLNKKIDVSDLTSKQIHLLIDFSKNYYKNHFGLRWDSIQ